MNYKKILLGIILSTLNIITADEGTIKEGTVKERLERCRKELSQGKKNSISEAQILITAFRTMISNAQDYYLANDAIEFLERTSSELEEQLKKVIVS